MDIENEKQRPTSWLTWQDEKNSLLIILVIVALLIQGILYLNFQQVDWRELANNTVGGLIQAVITFIIFDKIVERRDKERLKAQLIREMGSRDNPTALRAVNELRANGWLTDGSLQYHYFGHANLSEAALEDADLKGVSFDYANLENANLRNANLKHTKIRGANLIKADLALANLDKAELNFSNLTGAFLAGTSLVNANLFAAHLTLSYLGMANFIGASLWETKIEETNFDGRHLTDRQTPLHHIRLSTFMFYYIQLHGEQVNLEPATLPDGKKWDSFTDMRKFTYPYHPEFWVTDDPESPAFKENHYYKQLRSMSQDLQQ